jgi:hypothetical protein
MQFLAVLVLPRLRSTEVSLPNGAAPAAFILCTILIVFIIPFASWRGYPRGFSRFNWLGVTLLTGIVGAVLIWFANSSERANIDLARVIGTLGILLLATGLGSLGAIFFCKKENNHLRE